MAGSVAPAGVPPDDIDELAADTDARGAAAAEQDAAAGGTAGVRRCSGRATGCLTVHGRNPGAKSSGRGIASPRRQVKSITRTALEPCGHGRRWCASTCASSVMSASAAVCTFQMRLVGGNAMSRKLQNAPQPGGRWGRALRTHHRPPSRTPAATGVPTYRRSRARRPPPAVPPCRRQRDAASFATSRSSRA